LNIVDGRLCEGFVLKKDQKKDAEEEQISLEDLIEREVITPCLSVCPAGLLPVTMFITC